MQESGRKNRVVISCVTFDTVKITEPIRFYQATHAHLIVNSEHRNGIGELCDEFCGRVRNIVDEQSPAEVDVVTHNENTSDFTAMLRTVLAIIQREKRENPKSDIYVNISAGTPEYTAAATIASMMSPGTIPFSVDTKEEQISRERMREIYYDEMKRPVGLAKTVHDPKIVPYYPMNIHEEHLVRGLRILHQRNTSRPKLPVTSGKMIYALEEKGIWLRGEMDIENPLGHPENRKKDDRMKRSEAVYYQRDFVDKWLKNGWVRKNDLTKRYEVTDEGKRILETFYTD